MSQYLGDISAYALAVSQGYTGTEEEYAELMASYATVGQTAVTAAQTATTKASEAATSATTATTKASEATTAATTATNKAAEAQADADAAALDASQAMSAASTATTKASEATTAAATATSAKTDAVAANTAAQSAKTAAQTAQTGAETAAASVQSSAAQIQTNADDISELKEDFTQLDLTVNGQNVEITYVANEYVVGSTGAFSPYNGWSRTDYIDVSGVDAFKYSNSGTATSYNCFYDANKSPLAYTNLKNTTSDQVYIPNGAKYFAYSNPTNQIQLITWLNAPHTDGLVDDVRELSEKLEDIKIVMCDKLVALPNEQFDIHYDNIMANRNADCVGYKESFGSASYGMRDMARCINPTVGTYTLSLCFGDSAPSSYNAATLPSNISKKSATFKVISANSGSGLNRKVLLIGDSWTANGVYARELRSLFADNDEPMNITLLGTMGDNAEDVGASNGYQEGHGGWSSKTYCTMASANTYTNHFYNPSSQKFDFAYYMNYCGYASVDDVFINLGINDVESIEDFDESISYYDEMIASIRTYDSNIKIFIGLCGLPAEYEYTVPHSRTQRIKARRLLFHERLMSEYGDKESEKMFIVPLHLSIDSEHDFPSEQRARSFRDSTLVDYCTDIVHPNTIAYNKIADRIRTYIKYAETL